MPRKVSTIGDSPLDFLVPSAGEVKKKETPALQETKVLQATEAMPVVLKRQFTARVPVDLVERIRDAVYWTPGLTVDELAATALESYLATMETERGEPFPKRSAKLKVGRPVR
jgi:hypothetical protein